MAVVQFTATRSVLATHTAGNQYTWVFDLVMPYDEKPGGNVKRKASLSGKRKTIAYSSITERTITGVPVDDGTADALAWLEFLESTKEGESFNFDPRSNDPGTATYVACTMTDFYRFSFTGQQDQRQPSFTAESINA